MSDRKYAFTTGSVVTMSPRTPFRSGTVTEQVGKFGPYDEPVYLVKPNDSQYTDDTRFLIAQDALHGVTDYEAQNPQTVPALHVERAAKGTAEAIAELVTIADQSDGEQALEEMGHGRIAKALDIHEAEVEDLSADDLREQADEYLRDWPLCVEASTTFEIVLGTGGPDTRLMIECDRVEMNSVYEAEVGARWTYEPRRVFYRYSWSSSADFELTGDDRKAAEAFARRVVPELADA